jgi:hypothetical protein
VDDMDFGAADGIVVERVEANAHDHFFDLLAFNLCVAIVYSVVSEILDMLVGQIRLSELSRGYL